MNDNIRALPGTVPSNSRKQQFMDTVAQSYDRMVSEGREPMAFVYCFVAEKGGARAGYHTANEINDRNALHLARALFCIQQDMTDWEREAADALD